MNPVVVLFLALVGFGVLALAGWVMNIIALASMTGMSGLLVLRAIGIPVAPLGVVLGWFV